MRQINTHVIDGLNSNLKITVDDACHHYLVGSDTVLLDVYFQNGPIHECGVNGVSNEALLAIVRDRLEHFQAGEFACTENEIALDGIKIAIDALHSRTRKRLLRGVEGTSRIRPRQRPAGIDRP